ncbi:MAG: hypothetical protein J6O88_12445 [Chryseobacterium sp.]|uniref:hypothetical protein n=1 Tax=Chryseobacterium sp. TaxID=1871047 RepID=UPI001B23C911|nr:hypothetical protein [Chryseobacterium sp.]MBO6185478.1 hypothetical protein [Chryseobacterium sp.]
MSRIIILILITLSHFYNCQSNQDSIYIELPIDATYRAEENNNIYEVYNVIYRPCTNNSITFKKASDSSLVKKIEYKSIPTRTISFIYQSSGNNQTEAIRAEIKNYISYKDLLDSNPSNIISILKGFKNIYIVDKNNNAKKVTFDLIGSL